MRVPLVLPHTAVTTPYNSGKARFPFRALHGAMTFNDVDTSFIAVFRFSVIPVVIIELSLW